MRKRALMLVPESPLPPRCGNAWRDSQQISLLQRLGFEVWLAILKRRADLAVFEADRALEGMSCRYSRDSGGGRESLAQLVWRKASYLLGSRKNAYAWWTEDFHPGQFAREVIAEARPAVVLMRSLFLHFLPEIRQPFSGPVIVDCHDADVHLASEAVRSVPGLRKLGPWLNLQAVRRCCRAYLPAADEIWAVSHEDAARIHAEIPKARVLVVPSGMERPVQPAASTGRDGFTLLVANYGYRPNENGVAWLLDRVWPSVRRCLPRARLDLVGGRMPPRLRTRAESMPGVQVHGLVDRLEPFYEAAGLIVVPILEGGGTRVKIVEAWSHGKAVLTTSKGIEGLPAPAEAALIRDEPESFSEALAWLVSDAPARARLGASGLRHLEQHLSYAAIAGELARKSLLSRIAPAIPAPGASRVQASG